MLHRIWATAFDGSEDDWFLDLTDAVRLAVLVARLGHPELADRIRAMVAAAQGKPEDPRHN
jgi:hypothetical protein